jgi:lysine-N-methylase
MIRPQYAEAFRCLGGACEDTCCTGWRVDIDRATYERYQTVPTGPLRILLDERLERLPEAGPETTDSVPKGPFARIKMPPSLECPFLNAGRLCQIQVEHGAEYLSHICSTFPRNLFIIDSLEDKTLTLSCPEAARMVLLNPNFLTAAAQPERTFTWDEKTWAEGSRASNAATANAASAPALRSFFWMVRELSIKLIRNRKYPLWQRMFLLGTLARRLDAQVSGEIDRTLPALLKDFSAAVSSGNLRATLETVPADLALQLEMVMQLVKLRVGSERLQPRLKEILNAFVCGVGYPKETTLEGQSAQYAAAYTHTFAPFFSKHPHILENLLTNMIFRGLFPLGLKLFDPKARPEPAKEFARMATEFGLIKGLLIGVAGHRKSAFCADDVVQTVQVITKYFEHNATFLTKAQEFLAARKLDNAHGLTMLIRN